MEPALLALQILLLPKELAEDGLSLTFEPFRARLELRLLRSGHGYGG